MGDLRKKRNFSINLPENIVEELDRIREDQSRSRSNVVEHLIKLGLETYRKTIRKVLT